MNSDELHSMYCSHPCIIDDLPYRLNDSNLESIVLEHNWLTFSMIEEEVRGREGNRNERQHEWDKQSTLI